jgi:hypothetical protein
MARLPSDHRSSSDVVFRHGDASASSSAGALGATGKTYRPDHRPREAAVGLATVALPRAKDLSRLPMAARALAGRTAPYAGEAA